MMGRALGVLTLAFFITVAFQSYQLIRAYNNLETVAQGQQSPLEQAVQARDDAEALAGATAVLADKGNANAKQVVEIMRQQGITLRTPPQPSQAAPAPAKP